MQWLSSSPTARPFDREVGDLQNDLVGGVPVLSYLRYNVDLRVEEVKLLDPTLKDEVDRIVERDGRAGEHGDAPSSR